MQTELMRARENLRIKLIKNAEIVLREVLDSNLDDLLEVGIFGSVAKDKFTCLSDSDIYLLFGSIIPNRQTKGCLRSLAEENNCDIVFITERDFVEGGLLVENILESRIILWRKIND